MKQTRSLSEFSRLSEYARLYLSWKTKNRPDMAGNVLTRSQNMNTKVYLYLPVRDKCIINGPCREENFVDNEQESRKSACICPV